MKLIKKRINLIAIMMFIVFSMMLIIDFMNTLNEKEQLQQDLAQIEHVKIPVITEIE